MSSILDGLSSLFDGLYSWSPLFTSAVGIFCTFRFAISLLSFAHLYFFRCSSINTYITNSDDRETTWALVTGASDGIGKGFAEELCSRGVNVVLHGRSERKLHGVRDSLLERWPTRQIRVIVLEASSGLSDATKLNEAIKPLEELNLRILINNVGGGGTATPLWAPFTDRSFSNVGQWIDINVRFPTEITRALPPRLTKCQPSLIMNIGSGTSDIAAPYLQIYSGIKAYIQAWSRSLRLELQAEKRDVEVLHLQLGGVQSNTGRVPTSFVIPSSREFAKRALAVVGCGREVVWPYWPHYLQFGIIGALPEWLRIKLMRGGRWHCRTRMRKLSDTSMINLTHIRYSACLFLGTTLSAKNL